MARVRAHRFAAVLLTVTVVPAGSVTAVPAARGGGGECPLSALNRAEKPVEIVFWHSMTEANEDTLGRLTDEFNGSQDGIRVELVNQISYEDTLEKYQAGLDRGDLPDIAQIDYPDLQQMIDTRSVLPAQACVDADDYDLSDHLPRVVDAYTVDDTLWAMPFNVVNPILYYNKNAFRQAGLDPEQPPATLGEVREAAEAIEASGYPAGFALKIDAFFFEHYLGKAGAPLVDNDNGRAARASGAVFDARPGAAVFAWMAGMVRDDLAVTNPRTGAGAVNNFLAVANEQVGMTVDSTGALGTIAEILGTGQFADVELGVGPMPGPTGKGGVLVGGAALYIVNKSNREEQAAAWEFAKFLSEPEPAAEWAAATGYIPIRESAVELPVVQQRWAEIPGFRVAFDQLVSGKDNVASAGAVIGDYRGVRAVLEEAEVRMFTEGKKPRAALKDAEEESDEVIQEYNERVGA